MSEVTRMLAATERGEPRAAEELLPMVYNELRRLAAQKLSHEKPGQTLQATALVHEAWLRLGADGQPLWRNRAYFFAAAAQAMRQILVERARRRAALKRGGGARRTQLGDVAAPMAAVDDERLLAMDEALEKLAAVHPRKAELVKLHFFTGLTFEEAASVLGIAVPTAKEWWAYTRAWLAVQMRQSG
jgi:RNA polymerase sigma factor (TIGR02999 family)